MNQTPRGEVAPLRPHVGGGGGAPILSVIAPCYNEEPTLVAFVARMTAACRAVAGEAFELLLVNDVSRDGTWPLIRRLAEETHGVSGVNLARLDRLFERTNNFNYVYALDAVSTNIPVGGGFNSAKLTGGK